MIPWRFSNFVIHPTLMIGVTGMGISASTKLASPPAQHPHWPSVRDWPNFCYLRRYWETAPTECALQVNDPEIRGEVTESARAQSYCPNKQVQKKCDFWLLTARLLTVPFPFYIVSKCVL